MASKEDTRKKVTEVEKKKRNNPFMWIMSVVLLVVVVIAFVAAPIVGNASASGGLIFGSYDGHEIEYVRDGYLDKQVLYFDSMYKSSQQNLGSTEFLQYSVWKSAFDATVFHTALVAEAENAGFYTSEDQLDRILVTQGPYNDAEGRFDQEKYENTSNRQRDIIRRQMKENLYHQEALTTLTSSVIGSGEIDFLKDLVSTEKRFEIAAFRYSDFPDTEVKAFAEENSDLFRSAELSRITVKSGEKEAESLHEQLSQDPTRFTELAQTYSKDPYAEKGGVLGERRYFEMKNTISDSQALEALFSLEEGEISPVIEENDSWIIFRMDGKVAAANLARQETLDTVRTYMQNFEAGVIEDYLTSRAAAIMTEAEERGLSAAADSAGAALYTTGFAPVMYGVPSLSYGGQTMPVFNTLRIAEAPQLLSGAAFNDYFLESVASLKEDQISDPLVMNKAVILVRLDAVREAPEETLANADMMLEYAAGQWQSQQLKENVRNSDKFSDNFNTAFARLFASGE